MRKLILWVVIYLLGVVSGGIFYSTTYGANDRSRICGLAQLGAERAIPDLFVGEKVWTGRAGIVGHLSDGYREQAVGPAYS